MQNANITRYSCVTYLKMYVRRLKALFLYFYGVQANIMTLLNVNCKIFFFLFFSESKTKFSLIFVKITLTLKWFLFKLRSFLALRNWKFNNTQCLKNFPRHETNFQMSVSWTEFHDLKKGEFVFSKAFLIFSAGFWRIELLSPMKDLIVYWFESATKPTNFFSYFPVARQSV